MNNIVKKFEPSEKGKKIRILRMALKWSQTRLARESKVSRATIQNIEKGKHSQLEKTLDQVFLALEGPANASTPEEKKDIPERLAEIREEKGGYDVEGLENLIKDDPEGAEFVFRFLRAKKNLDAEFKSMKQYLGKKMETCFELPNGSNQNNKKG